MASVGALRTFGAPAPLTLSVRLFASTDLCYSLDHHMNKARTKSRYGCLVKILILLYCLAVLTACTTTPTHINLDQAHISLAKGDSIIVTMRKDDESYASGIFDHWEEDRLFFTDGMGIDLNKMGKIELLKRAADQETGHSIYLAVIQILLSPLYLLMWLGDIK